MTWIFCENRWILTDNFCLRVSTTRVTGTSSKMIDKKFIHWNILKSNFRWHIFFKLGNSFQLQLIDNFLNCSIPAYWLAWLSIQPVIWFPLFSRCCPFGQIQLQLLYPIRRGPEGSEIPPQSPQGLVGSTTLSYGRKSYSIIPAINYS